MSFELVSSSDNKIDLTTIDLRSTFYNNKLWFLSSGFGLLSVSVTIISLLTSFYIMSSRSNDLIEQLNNKLSDYDLIKTKLNTLENSMNFYKTSYEVLIMKLNQDKVDFTNQLNNMILGINETMSSQKIYIQSELSSTKNELNTNFLLAEQNISSTLNNKLIEFSNINNRTIISNIKKESCQVFVGLCAHPSSISYQQTLFYADCSGRSCYVSPGQLSILLLNNNPLPQGLIISGSDYIYNGERFKCLMIGGRLYL